MGKRIKLVSQLLPFTRNISEITVLFLSSVMSVVDNPYMSHNTISSAKDSYLKIPERQVPGFE